MQVLMHNESALIESKSAEVVETRNSRRISKVAKEHIHTRKEKMKWA